MHLGYARVSTADQHLDLQLDALKKADCRRVYQERVSGARAGRSRPELVRLLEQLREEDVVVVWKLDRLARSTRDLLEIMATIQATGAGFRSLSEPWADTTTHVGKLMMTIQTQRTRAAVHESAARVGLRLPPTDDSRRLEAQSKLVALLGRREPTGSSDLTRRRAPAA